VARYLIAQSGKQKYVQFVGDGMRSNNWPEAVRQHYGFADLSDLQVTWLEWVRQGSPALEQAPQLAGAHFRQALSAQVSAVQQASATFDTAEARAAAPAQSAAPVQPAVPVQPVALQSAAPRSDDGGLMPVSPSSGTPLAQSNAPSAGGWYSQQRDLRAAQSDGEGSAVAATSNTNSIASQAKGVEERLAVAATNPAPYRPGSIGRESAVHQSLARQQPIGRPGQTVLEPGMGYAPAQPPTVMRR
jgi:hypothetical protein